MFRRMIANSILSAEEVLSLLFLSMVGYFIGAGTLMPAMAFSGLFVGEILLSKADNPLAIGIISFFIFGGSCLLQLIYLDMPDAPEEILMFVTFLTGFGFTCLVQLFTEFARVGFNQSRAHG